MKNTNKKALLGSIISAVALLAVFGAVIGIFASGMKEASNKLDDAFGDLLVPETDTSVDTGTDTSTDTSTDSGSSGDSGTSEDTTVSNEGVFTFAKGDIEINARGSTVANYNVLVFYIDDLKANTGYKVSWSLGTTYEAYGFNFEYDTVSDVETPYVQYKTVSSSDYEYKFYKSSPSVLLKNSFTISTSDEGYFEMAVFRFSDNGGSEAIYDSIEAFKLLIKYIEIEEV